MLVVMVFMMLVFVLMLMMVFMMLVFVQHDVEITAFDAAGGFPGNGVIETFQLQTLQDGVQFFAVSSQIQQGGNRHIARYSRGSLEVKDFAHFMFSNS